MNGIPRIVLDSIDKVSQRKRLLAELGNPTEWVERIVVDPERIIVPFRRGGACQ